MAITEDIPSTIPDSDFNGFLQAGSSDSVNDVGVRTVQQSYINKAGQMVLPSPRSPHPIFTSLLLESASLVKMEGEFEQLDVIYKGKGEGETTTVTTGGNTALFGKVYGLSRTSSQEPLDAHPNFHGGSDSIVAVACGTDDGEKEDEDAEIIIRDSDGAFVRISDQAVEPSLRGVSSYLLAGQEFTVRYVSDDVPSVAKVGYIVENPEGAPSVSGSYNWLLIAIDYTQEGDNYEVTERYLLSGENGWADSIYGETL